MKNAAPWLLKIAGVCKQLHSWPSLGHVFSVNFCNYRGIEDIRWASLSVRYYGIQFKLILKISPKTFAGHVMSIDQWSECPSFRTRQSNWRGLSCLLNHHRLLHFWTCFLFKRLALSTKKYHKCGDNNRSSQENQFLFRSGDHMWFGKFEQFFLVF